MCMSVCLSVCLSAETINTGAFRNLIKTRAPYIYVVWVSVSVCVKTRNILDFFQQFLDQADILKKKAPFSKLYFVLKCTVKSRRKYFYYYRNLCIFYFIV